MKFNNHSTILRLTVIAIAGVALATTSNAATVDFSTLDGLDPHETLTATNNNLTSMEGRDFSASSNLPAVNNVDVLDATFRVVINFDNHTDGNNNHVIWESGGGTMGLSLVYSNGNTLGLRHSQNSGNLLLLVERTLTSGEISGGDVELHWTYDINASGDNTIALYVNRILAGSDSGSAGNDWSGSGAQAFGAYGHASNNNIAGTGNNNQLPNSVSFSSGSINLTEGRSFWGDTLVIPEPATMAMLGLGGLLLIVRRRRRA